MAIMSFKSLSLRRTPPLYVASFFCIAPLVALPPAAQARTRRHVRRTKKVTRSTTTAKPATTAVPTTARPNQAVTQSGLDTASSVRTEIAPAAPGAEVEDANAPAAAAAEDENAPGPPGPPGPPVAGAAAEDENAPGPPAPPAAGAAADDDNAPGPPGPPGPPAPGGDLDEVQTFGDIPALVTDDYWEVGVSSHSLNSGFSNWNSVYARTQYRLTERDALLAEVEKSHQFDDSGTYFALGDTHTFNNDWYGSLTVGSSTGGFYLPRVRVDAFLNRKLLKERNLVATVGAGYYKARDIHNDRSLYLGATYYFAPKWILEGGVRFNRSSPGSVNSTSQFAALTYGQERKRYITLRFGSGREAYQFIGPTTELVDFASNEASVTVRQWIGPNRGVNLVLDKYFNPSYDSRGISLGYFQNY